MSTKVGKKLLIKRTNPDGLRPIFINDLVVTHTEDSFFLTMSQIETPALLSEQEINGANDVDAVAVCKIVVTAKFMETIKDLLNNNYEQFIKHTTTEGN